MPPVPPLPPIVPALPPIVPPLPPIVPPTPPPPVVGWPPVPPPPVVASPPDPPTSIFVRSTEVTSSHPRPLPSSREATNTPNIAIVRRFIWFFRRLGC